MEFESREDVIIWICANQNARRNITPEQKAYLIGRRYESDEKERKEENTNGKRAHTTGRRGKRRQALAGRRKMGLQ
jgi:hypothetical protein